MSGSWLYAAFVALPLLKKRESVIEPFKRTAELAEDEQNRALNALERAALELARVVKEKKDAS